jgi:hypothetical protein
MIFESNRPPTTCLLSHCLTFRSTDSVGISSLRLSHTHTCMSFLSFSSSCFFFNLLGRPLLSVSNTPSDPFFIVYHTDASTWHTIERARRGRKPGADKHIAKGHARLNYQGCNSGHNCTSDLGPPIASTPYKGTVSYCCVLPSYSTLTAISRFSLDWSNTHRHTDDQR